MGEALGVIIALALLVIAYCLIRNGSINININHKIHKIDETPQQIVIPPGTENVAPDKQNRPPTFDDILAGVNNMLMGVDEDASKQTGNRPK